MITGQPLFSLISYFFVTEIFNKEVSEICIFPEQ